MLVSNHLICSHEHHKQIQRLLATIHNLIMEMCGVRVNTETPTEQMTAMEQYSVQKERERNRDIGRERDR